MFKVATLSAAVVLAVTVAPVAAQTASTTDKAMASAQPLLGKTIIFTAVCSTIQTGTYKGYRCMDRQNSKMLDLDYIYVGEEHTGLTDQSDFDAYMEKNCNGSVDAWHFNYAGCTMSLKFKYVSYKTFKTFGVVPTTWLLMKAEGDVATFPKRTEITK